MKIFYVLILLLISTAASQATEVPPGFTPYMKCTMLPDSEYSDVMVYSRNETNATSFFIGGRNSEADPYKNYFANPITILKPDPENSSDDDLVLYGDHCDRERGKTNYAWVYIPEFTDYLVIWAYAYQQAPGICGQGGEFITEFNNDSEHCERIH